MTIGQHISMIRTRLRQYGDDSLFTDALIYQALQQSAAIINSRKDKRKERLSDWNFPYYPIGMNEASPYADDCIGDVCKKWISIYKLPQPVVGRNRELVDIRTLDGREIPKAGKDQSVTKLDPIMGCDPNYEIINNYLVLNNARYKAVLVGMIPLDVTDWIGKKLCDENGNATSQDCYSITEDSFPLDGEYISMAHDMAVQALRPDLPNNINQENPPK